MFYRCLECGEIFDEPDEIRENVGEFWGTPAYESFNVCPCCKSDEIEEVDPADLEDEEEE